MAKIQKHNLMIDESTKKAELVAFIKNLYSGQKFIPLHIPYFDALDKKYINECLDSTFVSSIGHYTNLMEEKICGFTKSKYAIVTVNGTAALHIALILAGVTPGTEVITQATTFVATPNAIAYCYAYPTFLDCEKERFGLDPTALELFLQKECIKNSKGQVKNKNTGRIISACIPMHTFGHPVDIQKICEICDKWNIPVIEDSAESLGSFVKDKHTGTFGMLGVLSFNGNKTITTGGGGIILTQSNELANRAKHLTTTAKRPDLYEYFHDELGYNYRMPNLNAAMGCAQLDKLNEILISKREVAEKYIEFASNTGLKIVKEQEGCTANYWLNTFILDDKKQKKQFLEYTNANGVMTRPLWQLPLNFPMFKKCFHDSLENSKWCYERIINVPSSARLKV